MATKWVSLDKLRYAISKIHTLLQGKVDKVDGKGLSANDLTAARKGNYDAAYTHSQAAHAPADAEKNIIVGVQVNGSDLTPDGSRKVNVRVPTGALAGKSQVSETDLDDALKEKVNSASEGKMCIRDSRGAEGRNGPVRGKCGAAPAGGSLRHGIEKSICRGL